MQKFVHKPELEIHYTDVNDGIDKLLWKIKMEFSPLGAERGKKNCFTSKSMYDLLLYSEWLI